MNYPEPQQNGYCQCRRNPVAAFFCSFGHSTECHFPYSCSEAGCNHLLLRNVATQHKYDYTVEQVKALEQQARDAIQNGLREPYELDEHGKIVVKHT